MPDDLNVSGNSFEQATTSAVDALSAAVGAAQSFNNFAEKINQISAQIFIRHAEVQAAISLGLVQLWLEHAKITGSLQQQKQDAIKQILDTMNQKSQPPAQSQESL